MHCLASAMLLKCVRSLSAQLCMHSLVKTDSAVAVLCEEAQRQETISASAVGV